MEDDNSLKLAEGANISDTNVNDNEEVEDNKRKKHSRKQATNFQQSEKLTKKKRKVNQGVKQAIAKKWLAQDYGEDMGEEDKSYCGSSSTTLVTRSSPLNFARHIAKFSDIKKKAVLEMGFGPFMDFNCGAIPRKLLTFLVDSFDPYRSEIKLHGMILSIGVDDLTRVLGVTDGGVDIDLSSPAVGKVQAFHTGKDDKIWISEIGKNMVEEEAADDAFKVRFVLFLLGTLLCPTSATYVNAKYLHVLTDPAIVKSLNWATHVFRFLRDGVQSVKENKQRYVCGCVLFLELFYFDAISQSRNFVDKSLTPIVTWDVDLESKLLKWIAEKGGFDSTQIKISCEKRPPGISDSQIQLSIESAVARAMDSVVEKLRPSIEKSIKDCFLSLQPCINKQIELVVEKKIAGFRDDMINSMRADFAEWKSPMNEVRKGHVENDAKPMWMRRSPVETRTSTERMPSKYVKPPFMPMLVGKPKEVPGDPISVKVRNDLIFVTSKALDPLLNLCMTPNDIELLKYAFLTDGDDGKSEELVVKFENTYVPRASMACLLPEGWLNDYILNTVGEYCEKRTTKTWFLSTFYSQSVFDHGTCPDHYPHAGPYCNRKPCALKECEYVYAVCNPSKDHWFLIVVNCKQKDAEVWDSLYNKARLNERINTAKLILQSLDDVLAHDGSPPCFSTFNVSMPSSVPRQTNDYDCGLYVCKFMELRSDAFPWILTTGWISNVERVALALMLLKATENKVKHPSLGLPEKQPVNGSPEAKHQDKHVASQKKPTKAVAVGRGDGNGRGKGRGRPPGRGRGRGRTTKMPDE